MPLRKNKSQPEQGRGRQTRQGSPTSPAFSYYTSRTPDMAVSRTTERKAGVETGKQRRRFKRISMASAPVWLLSALAVLCIGKVLLLSTNPKVIVVGKSSVSERYLRPTEVYSKAAHSLLSSSITNSSKLTVNLDGTARALERQFPELQTVSLGVPLMGSRPIVYIQVASPSLVLQTSHGNYALNRSGIALAQLQTTPADIPLVVDQSGATPQPGKQFLPSSTVSFVQIMAYQLKAAHVAVSTFVLPSASPYELDVRLEGQPYTIRCNLETDALTQSGAAIGTMQQYSNSAFSSYIDVRVPGRVYYK